MSEQTVQTSPAPHITVVQCVGNLIVRGSDERRITLQARGEPSDALLQREGDTFSLTTRSDCLLLCPPATTLTIQAVRGDLQVEGLQGPLAVGTVNGDVRLHRIGAATLEQVFGDLSVRQTEGDLQVHRVAGDARIRYVEGQVRLAQVGADLWAEGLQEGLIAEAVGADVRLWPPFSPNAVYLVRAGSDLALYLPADPDLHLALDAGGRLCSHLPGLTLPEAEARLEHTLGAGAGRLEAHAGGHVHLWPLEPRRTHGVGAEFAPGLEALEGLGPAVEAHIAQAMAELEARLAESLGRMDRQIIGRRVEQAAEQARQAAERARREAERAAERARLRAEQAERRWQRASGQRPRPEPASDEERLRVLRLVEQGKITPEQAADLLAALEGR